ncbi:MAG TPA: hypothetical protein VGN70_11035 [Gammaproteobacteria bacterium]
MSEDQQAPMPDYAVMTPTSGFPAGWVRFDSARQSYVFTSLLGGNEHPGHVHHEPDEAVPTWVGMYRLRKIYPIPETVTADMMAAAPEMLELLKKVQALIDVGVSIGVDGVYLGQVIARAEGRG